MDKRIESMNNVEIETKGSKETNEKQNKRMRSRKKNLQMQFGINKNILAE